MKREELSILAKENRNASQLDAIPNQYRAKTIPLELTDLSDVVKNTFNGTGTIPPDSSVSPVKIAGASVIDGYNMRPMFADVKSGTYWTDGSNNIVNNVVANYLCFAVDVEPNTIYKFSSLSNYVFTDSLGVYISKGGSTNPLTTPANAVKGYFSISTTGGVTIDDVVMCKGTVLNSEVRCKINWLDDTVPLLSVSTENIVDNSIEESKIVDNAVTTNKILDGAVTDTKFGNGVITPLKINNIKIVDGYNMRPTFTGIKAGTYYYTSPNITNNATAGYACFVADIQENTQYIVSDMYWCIFVDENGTFISQSNVGTTFTSPVGAVKAYISYHSTIVLSIDDFVMCKGTALNSEIIYTLDWLKPNIIDNSLGTEKIKKRFYNPVTKTIYMDTANPFKLYFRNVLSLPKCEFYGGQPSTGLTADYYNDYVQLSTVTAGTYTLPYEIYDDNYQLLDSGTITIIVKVVNPSNCKVLIIGDSTVYGQSMVDGSTTNVKPISQNLYEMFSNSGKQLTLLGTQGTAPYKHEGYPGRAVSAFFSAGTSFNGTETFGTFDFSYYMTQQGYDSVDYVIIQLGINDMSHESFVNVDTLANQSINYISQMVQSIQNYNSNIKVIINLTIPPNNDRRVWTAQMQTLSPVNFIKQWIYHNNNSNYVEKLQNKFLNTTNVYIAPTNLVLDTTIDISDSVHPTADGYTKLSQVDFDTINYIQNP